MITDELKKLLEQEPVAVATVNADGSPNVIAVMAVKVFDNTTVVITDNYMRITKENVFRDPRICLGAWTKEGGFKCFGKAKYFTDGKWITYIKSVKDNEGYPCKGAIVVTLESVKALG